MEQADVNKALLRGMVILFIATGLVLDTQSSPRILAATPTFLIPTAGHVGFLYEPGGHKGIDIWSSHPNSAPCGNEVRAAHGGTVKKIWKSTTYDGNNWAEAGENDPDASIVVLEHTNVPGAPDPNKPLYTFYIHMAKDAGGRDRGPATGTCIYPTTWNYLRSGQPVEAGMPLGRQGDLRLQGDQITHLHFSVSSDYLNETPVGDSASFLGLTNLQQGNALLYSGQTINLTLNAPNEQDSVYFYADQGDLATIRMDKLDNPNNTLNSYLVLYAPDGTTEVTRDDDSGGDNNSLINNVTLSQSGYYRIVAKSAADSSSGQYSLSLTINMPDGNAVDVFLLVDLSSSFADDLPVFKAQAPVIMSTLKALIPDIRFGLGKYEDYPIRPFGDSGSGDKAYERLVDLTDDTEHLLATIAGLTTRDGGDDPESQQAALFQATTGAGQNLSGVGFLEASIPSGQQASFRDEATKIFLLWTDAPFHQPGDPGAIPYPGPSFDETVAAIKSLVSPTPKVIGISSGGGGEADLKAIAKATDALAPAGTETSAFTETASLASAGGVDCNSDGIVDILPGEPLVCSIGFSGEGIAEAMMALIGAAAEPTPPLAEAPNLISPPDGQVFYPSPLTTTLTTTLQWSSVPNAVSYTVEIDCFHCCVVEEWCTDVGEVWDINSGIVETTFTFDFVGAQPGRWRVWAVFPGGIEGSKSDWWTFEYLPAIPGAP